MMMMAGGGAAAAGGDRVRLNVGGTLFETARSTLDKLQSDYFARLLDPHSGFRQPLDGVHFVDRDAECFRVILNMARYGEIHLTGGTRIEMVEQDAEFYLIDDKYKSLVSDYKMAYTNQAVERMPLSASGGVHLNISFNEYLSDKGKLFHHHHSLLMRPILGCKGVSLLCQKHCAEFLTIYPPNPVTCLRCRREIQMGGPERHINEWCHKCKRCSRCTESLCLPV